MMYSFLLKQKQKEKEKEKERELDTEMEPHHHSNESTPRVTPTGSGSLSPPTRRWQMTLLEIRRERYFQDLLLRRLQTRGDLFGRLFLVRFEDMMRRAVQQELHQLFSFINVPQRLLPDQNTQARYQLRFTNRVKDPTFTDDAVTDKEGDPIEVAIYDSHTQSIISPDCFLSSAKIRITALDAEFWKNKGDNWSTSEFIHSVLKERNGKGPILAGGGLTVQVKNGRGTFESIVFKDNSSWTKSGFRLGVTIVVEGEADAQKVQEGVSEPFRVKDRRGKASQKPDLLKLTDKIQSLKNIGKDRASLLEKNNIKTVEDFLCSYYFNQQKLRMILGIKSESDKGWKTMVEHAMECNDEFQAKKNVWDNANHPEQVLLGQQVNIANPSMDQPYVDWPVYSNTNLVSPQEEVLHGRTFHQEQFCISSDAIQMSGLNVHMLPIPGLRYVGSSSSEPNHCEHNLINSGFAEPQILSESVPIRVSFPSAESAPSDIRHTSQLQQASGQKLARNISLTNGRPLIVDLVSSQPNPCENTINNQGDMSACYGELTPLYELSPVNGMTTESGNMMNVDYMHNMIGSFPLEPSTDHIQMGEDLSYIFQFSSSSNSFQSDTGIPVHFTESMSNSVYVSVGPSSPNRKAKRKALLKWIISPAVARKRARAAPPVTQTTVLAM